MFLAFPLVYKPSMLRLLKKEEVHVRFFSGREDDDHRLITDAEEGRSLEINNPGAYPTCCVELSLDGLAVNTVLQSSHINDYEGASGTSISFDWAPQVQYPLFLLN